jgi:hypothetical protein
LEGTSVGVNFDIALLVILPPERRDNDRTATLTGHPGRLVEPRIVGGAHGDHHVRDAAERIVAPADHGHPADFGHAIRRHHGQSNVLERGDVAVTLAIVHRMHGDQNNHTSEKKERPQLHHLRSRQTLTTFRFHAVLPKNYCTANSFMIIQAFDIEVNKIIFKVKEPALPWGKTDS